jgi:hypothetical protein
MDRVHYESTCPEECTSTFGGPITVFHSFHHAHSYGREMWTNKFDANSGRGVLLSSKQFWSFAFQDQISGINITVNPGDRLSTHCVYDVSFAAAINIRTIN